MSAEMDGNKRPVPDAAVTRVLVIDDEAPIRLLCRVNLEAEGIQVLEAADGTTGLDLARDEQPDVVLLDVMMPGLDGWRVAEELLEDDRTRGIPIIFLTARAEFRDRARGLDIGGVDYVTKPFNPLELAPLVRDLLDADRPRRARRAARREARRAARADRIRVAPSRRPTLSAPRGVAQPGRAPGLGAGGRQFESAHPDSATRFRTAPFLPMREQRERRTRGRCPTKRSARSAPPSREPHAAAGRDESRLADPRLRDLSFRDWREIFVRAVKEFLADNGTMLASALAYSTFFAIPSVLLVVVGIFTLVVGPDTISSLMEHFSNVMPAEATSLLGESLHRLDRNPSTSIAMTIVGLVLALWSTTGAMTTYMTALNLAYERKDGRSFLRKRLVALELVAVIGFVFLLVAVLLIFGPPLEQLVASHAGPLSGRGRLDLVDRRVADPRSRGSWPRSRRSSTSGPTSRIRAGGSSLPARSSPTVVWLAASGAFAFYTSNFGSYNKTWGSLAAVIMMLTWLWLAAIALLLGAEINAEAERSRELRQGQPAERELLVPTAPARR